MVVDISHSDKTRVVLMSAGCGSTKCVRGNTNVPIFNSPIRVTSCSCNKRVYIRVVRDVVLKWYLCHSHASDKRPYAGDGITLEITFGRSIRNTHMQICLKASHLCEFEHGACDKIRSASPSKLFGTLNLGRIDELLSANSGVQNVSFSVPFRLLF